MCCSEAQARARQRHSRLGQHPAQQAAVVDARGAAAAQHDAPACILDAGLEGMLIRAMPTGTMQGNS